MNLDDKVDLLELSVRNMNILSAHGIITIRDLLAVPLEEIRTWKNMGERTLENLVSCVTRAGFSLASSARPPAQPQQPVPATPTCSIKFSNLISDQYCTLIVSNSGCKRGDVYFKMYKNAQPNTLILMTREDALQFCRGLVHQLELCERG